MARAAELDRSADTIDAFRAEARAWLEANFPQSLRGKDNAMSAVDGPTEETAEQKAWREAMGAKGWGTPTWPKEYGG
ncbi:acyl-CoA dehydrogenase family protein, partial [Pseudomonas aeruginosa]